MSPARQAKRPKLRLVYSAPPAPPAERMLTVALEIGRHLGSFHRHRRDARYHERFQKRTKALMDRMRKAAIYDRDDVLGAATFVQYEVIDPICNRGGCDPSLLFARDVLQKALDWLLAQPPVGPGCGPPRLVG